MSEKITKPMSPERRLAAYARQRHLAQPSVDRLTPRQRRRYTKKLPYWERLNK